MQARLKTPMVPTKGEGLGLRSAQPELPCSAWPRSDAVSVPRYRSRNESEADLQLWILIGFMVWAPLAAALASTPVTFGLNLSINCPSGRPMSIVSTVPPAFSATVIQFVSKAEAQKQMSHKEATTGELVDPAYINNQRVTVEWRVAPGAFQRMLVIVPAGMTVHVGQEVSVVPSHGDPNNLCLYIPNLIVP
jgi:hypothetical protein